MSRVLPFTTDRYKPRADGDFLVRRICRGCAKDFEVHALEAMGVGSNLCGECLNLRHNLEFLFTRSGATLPPKVYVNWAAVGKFIVGAAVMTGVAWFLLWGGLTGYRYVDGAVTAIKEALR